MTLNYLAQDADINEKIAALEGLLNDVFGPDQIVIRSTKLEILHLLGSSDVEKRLSALEKVVFYDAAYRGKGSLEDAFKNYEEGMKLVKSCNEKIEKIEKQILVLNGEPMEDM